MVICNKCGKQNQDHYKFCLGCGNDLSALSKAAAPQEAISLEKHKPVSDIAAAPEAEMSRPQPSERPKTAQAKSGAVGGLATYETNSPSGVSIPPTMEQKAASGVAAGFPSGVAPMPGPAAAATKMILCPTCGAPSPQEFVFCGGCGARLKSSPLSKGKGPAPAASAPAVVTQPRGKFILIMPDGSEGGAIPLNDVETIIGREKGSLFEGDFYLSPKHASLIFDGDNLVVADLGSLNGVFYKITVEQQLEHGSMFRIGQELLRLDFINPPQTLSDGTEIMGSPNPGFWGRLNVIIGPSLIGSAFPLMGNEIVLGRERGDIIFSEDGYVSGAHARLTMREDGCFLSDLGSSNGSFFRINQTQTIASGTFLLMGQQLFRVDYR